MAHEMKHARRSVTPEARRERREKQKAKMAKGKKSKGFRVFLLVWVLILVAFGAYSLHYVKGLLNEMQSSTPTQIISDTLEGLNEKQIGQLFEFNTELEGSSSAANVMKFFKDKAYTVKQVSGTDDYNVYNGERRILTVNLKKVRTVSKLAIFNYTIYELSGITATEDKEFYHCEITAPKGTEVSLNGKVVEPDSSQEIANFADASAYIELPGEDKYVLDHLSDVSTLKISSGGKNVDYEYSENIVIDYGYEKFDTLEAAGCDFDVMKFAENWSKFMTDDLTGSRHGFYTIAADVIEKSEMYQKAWAWATQVDITFVSGHTLKNPAFTDETATNIVKYSDDAISVDIHLVKHMHITRTGDDHDDVMDSTLYLIRYKDAWKVINMRGKAAE